MSNKKIIAKRLTTAQINKIFVLKEKGLSNMKIAAKLGCSDTTVAYHLKK